MNKQIGVLWQRKTKDGQTYLSGIIERRPWAEDIQIVVFSNKNKKGKAPDWQILASEPKEERKAQLDDGLGGVTGPDQVADDMFDLNADGGEEGGLKAEDIPFN